VGAYQLYRRKRRRRRAPLVITSTTPQPQPAVTLQPVEEVVPEPIPRVPAHPPAKRVVRIPSGGVGRVEVREESRGRRPTRFRSIAVY